LRNNQEKPVRETEELTVSESATRRAGASRIFCGSSFF